MAELKRGGITIAPHEAVAIVQKLIHDRGLVAPAPPYGPPSLENVELGVDGSVVCRACEITPAVAEIAILLQALLPPGAPLAGGLRYAIARALHEVDAPPFDSLDEFSDALVRYESGDRAATVRRLLRRAAIAPVHLRVQPRAADRRRSACTLTDLRRELREADRELYERPAPVLPLSVPAWLVNGLGATRGAALRLAAVAALVVAVVATSWLLWAMSARGDVPAPLDAVEQSALRGDIALPAPAPAAPVVRTAARGARTAAVNNVARSRPQAPDRTVTRGRAVSRTHRLAGLLPHIRFVDDFGARR